MQQFFANSTGSHNSNFVFIDPFANAPYGSSMDFKVNKYFQSRTLHDANYYLSGAGSVWFLRDKTQMLTHSCDPDCPLEEEMKIEIIDNIDVREINYPIGDVPVPYFTLPSWPPVYNLFANVDCRDN